MKKIKTTVLGLCAIVFLSATFMISMPQQAKACVIKEMDIKGPICWGAGDSCKKMRGDDCPEESK